MTAVTVARDHLFALSAAEAYADPRSRRRAPRCAEEAFPAAEAALGARQDDAEGEGEIGRVAIA